MWGGRKGERGNKCLVGLRWRVAGELAGLLLLKLVSTCTESEYKFSETSISESRLN